MEPWGYVGPHWWSSGRVAVTGGRDYAPGSLRAFVGMLRTRRIQEVRHGACPTGLDAAIDRCTYLRTVCRVVPFVAPWERLGRRAGPVRNGCMLRGNWAPARECAGPTLELGQVGALFRFPGGRGTDDCTRQARKLGIPVLDPRTGEPWTSDET